MGWPELICVTVAVLGIAMSTAALLVGETTLAFLGVIGVGGGWAAYAALADAREAPPPRLRAHVRELVERRRIVSMAVMCARPGCGEMRHLSQMDWDPILGHVCKPYHCKGDEPVEAA
jgi:hypothetical protein